MEKRDNREEHPEKSPEEPKEQANIYHCPLGAYYVIKSPFPVYELQDGEYVRAIDSDSEEGRNILLSGKGVLYIGITDAEGTEVSDMDILSVLRSLMELFGSERQYEHLAEPVAWHLKNFEDGSD